jgi:lysophospholipase L1-like esterase
MSSRSPSMLRRFPAGIFAVVLLTCVGALSAAGRAEAAAKITWRVENPFRFFIDPHDTEAHRATYLALGPKERSAPILSAERALQSRQPDGWAATMFRKTCWTNNRFKCDAYDDYINPTSHAVIAEIGGIDDAANLSCTWLTAPRNAEPPRGEAVTQPCNEPARFVVPYPAGMVISVEIGGVEVAKEDVRVRDILIAGMGDSFASGEGNPDLAVRFSRERAADYSTAGLYSGLTGYPARIGPWRELGDKAFIKENARWLDQACHRSLYSEQLRAALQLAIEDPHRAVTYVGVSCAGAEVTYGLFLRYKGNEWVPDPPRLSQISAVAEAQCGAHATEALDLPEAYHINGQIPELKGGLVLRKCPQDVARKIDLILLSIGGNDIGFSRLLANAILSNESLLRELGGWLGEVHGEAEASAQLDHLGARYKSLNRALHNILYMPWSESDRILLVAYPGLALEGDGSETCKDGQAGLEVVPDFQLSETKLRLGTWFGDKLHRLMRESADEYGWTFVETHRRAFIGRGICAGLSVEGVSQADDLRLPRKIDGVWTPYNPADYQPYATRQRWFRTPNDAFMTANFHVAAGLLTKVLKFEPFAPFQLILASTYSGAFHPTAEGQAAIADAVVDKARAVLAKYGQGPDSANADYTPARTEEMPPPPVPEPGRDLPDVKSVLEAPPENGAPQAASGTTPATVPRTQAEPDAPVPQPFAPATSPQLETSDTSSREGGSQAKGEIR